MYETTSRISNGILTEAEVADRLAISVRTLQSWRQTGRGPIYLKAGRSVRYRWEDLQSWIETNLWSPKRSDQ